MALQFEAELRKVGGCFYRARGRAEVSRYVTELAMARGARRAIAWKAPILEELRIADALIESGVELVVDTGNSDFTGKAINADLGISGADYALGDTGTLVVVAGAGRARSVSLVTPVHIAIVKQEQLLSGLDDLFPLLRTNQGGLPSAITFITGPSRTADIEMTLVVGVHGPQQLHVVLLDPASSVA